MEFALLPYSPSESFDLTIGRIHFFNFHQFKDQYIPDEAIRQKIERICNLYVDAELQPIRTQTIAVIDNNNTFQSLDEQQRIDVSRYALSLFFCTIVRNSRYAPLSSDDFQLYFHNFNLHDEAISFTVGSFVSWYSTLGFTYLNLFQTKCF